MLSPDIVAQVGTLAYEDLATTRNGANEMDTKMKTIYVVEGWREYEDGIAFRAFSTEAAANKFLAEVKKEVAEIGADSRYGWAEHFMVSDLEYVDEKP